MGSLFLASILGEYLPWGLVFIRASCRGKYDRVLGSNLAVWLSAAMVPPSRIERIEKERVEESWAPLIRLPMVEIRRQITF